MVQQKTALFRKLKSLEEVKPGSLAGKMGVVIDLVTRLPVEIWFQEKPTASDTRFEENLLQLVSVKTLLLLDRGFYHFQFWQRLIDKGIHFITRIKINAAIEYQTVFTDGHALRAQLRGSCTRSLGQDRLWNKKNAHCYSSVN